MGDLKPLAFDIETTGFDSDAKITVAGLAADIGAWIALNTSGREADSEGLAATLQEKTGRTVRVSVYQNERELLTGVNEYVTATINGDTHYLTAFNGERWKGGFDLPFLRRVCARHNATWPFQGIPYVDVMDLVERFNTDDCNSLEGAYNTLIGEPDCDPFDDSARAVTAHENGDWIPLLLHNLADIQRTRSLAVVAEYYVPKSDFNMKNLTPPEP